MAAWIDKARSSPNCFITVLHFSQMRMGFESVGFKASFAPSDAMIAAPVLPIGDREAAYAAHSMRCSVSVAAAMIKGASCRDRPGRSGITYSRVVRVWLGYLGFLGYLTGSIFPAQTIAVPKLDGIAAG
jgi:hypothetical protein